MKHTAWQFFALLLLVPFVAFAQNENFSTKRIVNPNTAAGRFRHPFAMVMGPDDSLWVTERRGYVMKVSTVNGGKSQLLNISAQVRFTASGTSIKQDGMFGIALHPELNQGTGNDYVYIAYCYDSSALRRVCIVRYQYNRAAPSLSNPLVLLRGIWGSDDHNGGRLIIGNYGTQAVPDYKLLYTVGDQGNNQFDNACDSIESQYIPSLAQVSAGDIRRYCGKILRMNLDGSIPSDNPVINGVRSHIFTYGHRNPQGLVFERDDNNRVVPNGILYESEQGPATDDEVNVIEPGKNYGWPRVAGMKDNGWYKYYKWAGTANCGSYPGECSSQMTSLGLPESSFSSPDYKNPIFDMYNGTPPGGTACNWLTNPTLAPSSVAYYPFHSKIPGWERSLLMPTLKASAVYRLKLNESGTGALSVSDSIIEYFKEPGALNRYRDIVIANDGISFYLLTDSVGATSGPSAGQNGGITDKGCILEYKYTGAVLSIPTDTSRPYVLRKFVRMYPNPASDHFIIEAGSEISKPVRFEIFDTKGMRLMTGISRQRISTISIVQFPAGVYIVKLYNRYDVPVSTEKIIKQ
ncbi:MAG: PQQ-dependent sugar dehydrogenase [Ferruginibacter sp.]